MLNDSEAHHAYKAMRFKLFSTSYRGYFIFCELPKLLLALTELAFAKHIATDLLVKSEQSLRTKTLVISDFPPLKKRGGLNNYISLI